MADPETAGALVERLVADLHPVRRLRPASVRTLAWLGVMAALTVALGSVADLGAVARRLSVTPDMWLAVVGSTATSVLAAFAAFELCLPDRSRLWALLPLPGLALWVGASGMGCARSWLIPGTHEASWSETRTCMAFIIGLSVPISIFTFAMLRRAYTLVPTLTAVVAGLAVASAAATMLNLFHPYDAALDDLLVHAVAVSAVVIANRMLGGWALRPGTDVNL